VHFGWLAVHLQLTYRWLLEQLAAQGYAVVATPFVNTLEHAVIAQSVLQSFESAIAQLHATGVFRKRYLPIYGLGHAWAANPLTHRQPLPRRTSRYNILVSFNNYAAREAIPLRSSSRLPSPLSLPPSPWKPSTSCEIAMASAATC